MAIINVMEQFLIIAAIIIACWLLSRAVLPPRRPRFRVLDRLPTDGIIYKASVLGKACRSTERGNGVDIKCLKKLKRSLCALQKKAETSAKLEEWESTILENSVKISTAADKARRAMRFCYMLGHVRGVPRVFLLCNEIVGDARGDVSASLLSNAVNAFNGNAPLTYSELNILPDVLRFCLLGMMIGLIDEAGEKLRIYEKGVSDGKTGKVDLDSLWRCDYVCGLYSEIDGNASAYDVILNGNGINRSESERARRLMLSETTAVIDSIVRSLDTADAFGAEKLIELSETNSILSRNEAYRSLDISEKIGYLAQIEKTAKKQNSCEAVVAHYAVDTAKTTGVDLSEYVLKKEQSRNVRLMLIYAPITLFAVAFVLVCIFASPRYAAVFPVIALIIYACFRLYAPIEAVRALEKLSDIIVFKRKIDPTYISPSVNRRADNIEYFGGESTYKKNTLIGRGVSVVCDNRGAVTVSDEDKTDDNSFSVDIGLKIDSSEIKLSACDGVFERHKTIYRAITSDIEFSAELICATDMKCCCFRLIVVNRTAETKHVKLLAVCEPIFASDADRSALKCETKKIVGGAALICDSDVVGIGMGENSDNFGVKYASEHGACGLPVFGKSFSPALIAEKDIAIDKFASVNVIGCLAFSDDVRSTERQLALVKSDGYFDFAQCAARVYCDGSIVSKQDYDKYDVPIISSAPIVATNKEATHCDVPLPLFDYALKLGIGGFLKDGGYAVDLRDGQPMRAWRNYLCDGDFCAEITHTGGSYSYSKAYPNGLTANSCRRDDFSSAFVAIGESANIWSPTVSPIGKGNIAVVHRFGYSEYLCGYNGFFCTLKRYIARGKRAEIFDLVIENRESVERKIDVMFSVEAAVGLDTVTACKDRVSVTDKTVHNGFCILASERIRDTTAYKEGYFVRGKIDRVFGFGKDGATIAPTVSVRIKLPPDQNSRILFSIAECRDGGLEHIDACDADKYLKQTIEYYSTFNRIELLSSDMALNNYHKWSLYQAYVCGFLRESVISDSVTRNKLTECKAVKYVDSAAVKKLILSACSMQYSDGSLSITDESCGDLSLDSLLLSFTVMEYIKHTGDYAVLEESTPFSSRKRGSRAVQRASVAEHCMRAVEYAVSSYDSTLDRRLRRMFIDLRHFYADCCSQTQRRSKFISAFGKIMNNSGCSAAQSVTARKIGDTTVSGVRSIDALIRIFDLYGADDCGTAYSALKQFIGRGDTAESAARYGAEPYFICEYILSGELLGVAYGSDPSAAALYYALVTEKLIGLNIRGTRARINPQLSDNAPKIEFELYTDKGRVRITVDATEKVGEWQIRADRITYATDRITLSDSCDTGLVFYRNGVA